MRNTRVGIVGGGIAGLYTAWMLARDRETVVSIYETRPVFGGRIETVNMAGYLAECGPMRFEPGIQPLLSDLVTRLDLRFEDFSPPSSAPPGDPATRGYDLRPDERLSRDSGALTTLAMLRLGVLRMFGNAIPQDLRQLTEKARVFYRSQDPEMA
jgi:phytoene dehydrogenase-like protein